ncbi:MAG TPA: bifunctional glycosyltransferase family 2 protein/CDP-glycerol:glycerophosphate glycerophosphotransferase [Streptosporangiaceae bacterium]|nr:bifunctional glycosyltransferase family 2 protein/CDP-glycerol:glycerophosphate glycerophosphotransferase [Streptosporangiaceae bacterium]
MAGARISVVVPFYNNAGLLGDCLASIAAQTAGDLEVVMVNDGSTDASEEVAAAQVAADSRFSLITIPNSGPGAARNRGVAAATGEFLGFVDADDVLPPDAYATMLATLEATGSDFVSGGVLRLTQDGLGPSGLHDQAIKTRRLRTSIDRATELLYDVSVFNKLFRRSFWDEAGLSLPEGMFWEDLVAMTRAHVLARAVDVITDPVYHWRDRDAGAPSITQSRTAIVNFRDRIAALELIDAFLRERGTPALLRAHQHKALVNDLWLYVRDLPVTSAAYQVEFIGLAGRYLRTVEPRVLASQPAARKLAYYLIAADRGDELIGFATWLAANPARTPPMVRSFGRPRSFGRLRSFGQLRADLPLRRSAKPAIPDRVFRPQWRELDPQVRVDSIGWQGRSLVIEGSAYVPSVDIKNRRNISQTVVLAPIGGLRPPIVVRATSLCRPDVTKESAQDRYSYDWSGFRCRISPRWFGAGGRWLVGEWDCFVLVRARSVWRPARLHSPGPGAEHPSEVRLAAGISFGAYWAGRRLRVRVRREAQAGAGQPTQPRDAAAVVASGGLSRPVPGPRDPAAVVVRSDWSRPASYLRLDVGFSVTGPSRVVLRRIDGWERHVVEVAAAGEPGQVSVTVPVAAMSEFGYRAPLRDGRWLVQFEAGDGAVLPVRLAGADRRRVRIGGKLYRCAVGLDGDGDALVLEVGPALAVYERGRIRRRLLRDLYYPLQSRLPVRDRVLFVSFDGKSAADNPLGLAQELRRRGDGLGQVWAVRDRSVLVPDGARSVLIGTAAYFAALGRSRYLIANDHLPQPHRRRRGQRYVQTWHGTPLKRLGYDIARPSFFSGSRYFDFMAADVARWDQLISPNPFATPIFRTAFKYDGEVIETGYPRNDALLAGTGTAPDLAESGAGSAAESARAVIKGRLGVPDGRRVAMYVPTWRDDQHHGDSAYRLDFQLDLARAAAELSDEFVLLVRGHHLMEGWVRAAGAPGFAIDVTGYPDINDLLVITDVLITDYSSVMFDFAPTGRPMLFFTYDLEQYRDQLRGFYFDFEAEAPGPLLATSDEVIAALADLDQVAARYLSAREAFVARYCPLDDGKASVRACDQIFKD